MAQHGRRAGSHPDEPPPKRRTLQIKIGRPKPSADDQASPSPNRGIRISLKRKPSVPESHATPPRFAAQQVENDDEDEQQVDSDDASEQDEDEEGDDEGDDEPADEGEEEDDADEDDKGGEGDEEEEEEGRGEEDEEQEQDGEQSKAAGDASSAPRVRGKNGAFKSTSANGSLNLSRRPIKRLRSKGLYEALPKLIENLQRRDSYKFFCEPVNPDDVPGYTDVIKTPMDFGTMQRKVNDRLYSHMEEFKSDFLLVVNNAMTFNPEGTLYYNEAKRISTWGSRAIEREGMAVNDNGRAGVKADETRRQKALARQAASTSAAASDALPSLGEGSSRRQLRGHATAAADDSLPQASEDFEMGSSDVVTRAGGRGGQIAFSAGVQAIMEAARVTSQARQRAAIALGLTAGTLTREDSVMSAVKGEDDLEVDDDDDLDASDEEGVRASVPRDLQDRSGAPDESTGMLSRRLGSSQPGGTPSTPMAQRQPSPDTLRKRLAAVTGAPIQALASPMGPNPGASRASKQAKHKSRLGAPGTPKRLLARTDLTDLTGSGTPVNAALGASLAPPAAAAQIMANMPQTQLRPGMANYSFDDDGSINPDDLDDLQTFITLHRSGKQILMPTLESLHPIPFIPGDYTSNGTVEKEKEQSREEDRSKGKDKAKDKTAADDDGESDDDDGKEGGREKGDKDPLSTLPPLRPGAPDPLYSAIAPEPEPLHSNLSHDVEPLPPHFRNMPFLVPSMVRDAAKSTVPAGKSAEPPAQEELLPRIPCSWSNPAYEEALKNDKRPKKQKDKEREKEKETLEDWSYFRPTLTRLLEITDLGPFGALAPQADATGAATTATKVPAKGKNANVQAKQVDSKRTRAQTLSTKLAVEGGVEAIKAELQRKRLGFTSPKQILQVCLQAVRNNRKALVLDSERRDAARGISDMVYGNVASQAYIRSIGEFVGGAMHHAMLLDDADDEEEQHMAEAEARLVLAAALRQAKEVESTPEPTAASRRGPFMWRDTTEESGGTATPPDEPADPETVDTSGIATPARVDDAKMVDPAALSDLHVVVEQLTPMAKPLAEVVEEEVIRPLTGDTLDVLHLIAVLLESRGSEALNIEEVESRLLKNKVMAHALEDVDATEAVRPKTAKRAPKDAGRIVKSPTQTQPEPVTTPCLPPVPFATELEWLKDQPHLTQLLDEARNDVDSLGSILNYIVQNA